MSDSFPGLKPLHEGCVTNRDKWQKEDDVEFEESEG